MQANRHDPRRLRAWVKVQLSNSADAYSAADAVNAWRGVRQAAYHLTRAIRLYDALLKGDTSLLIEFFPMLGNINTRPSAAAYELPSTPTARPTTPPRSRTIEKSAADDLADFADMF